LKTKKWNENILKTNKWNDLGYNTLHNVINIILLFTKAKA